MVNFEIKFSKEELDLIITSLGNTQERLNEQLNAMKNSYYELPANEKLFWRNKSDYDNYKDTFRNHCCKQSEETFRLEEKIKEILYRKEI